MIQLLAQLHAADVLQCDVTPDAAELFERHERRRAAARLVASWPSLFSWRFPLFDPERFLQRTGAAGAAAVRAGRAALLWLAVVVPAVVAAGRALARPHP